MVNREGLVVVWGLGGACLAGVFLFWVLFIFMVHTHTRGWWCFFVSLLTSCYFQMKTL